MKTNYILVSYKKGVRRITLNRPTKKNALCSSMYETLTNILNEDAKNDQIVVTILTGCGSYFSSGNDLKLAMTEDIPSEEKLIIVRDMIAAFINYPKLIIAVVNGPAIGIGATMLALCDIIYVTDKAVFDTPFVKLGLCVEGVSSFTFPYNLGRSKASEVIYLNHKLNAQEAYQFGLVSKVIPHAELEDFINELYKYGELPVNTVKINKRLLMANFQTLMMECNNREMEKVGECVESEEFSNAVMKFLTPKSKL